jgi:hypothetical protein
MARLVVDAIDLERAAPIERIRYKSDDATLWVWIGFGLAQATITMLMAFDVIDTLTPTEVCTSVSLILYVAVNELYVRPQRTGKWQRKPKPPSPPPEVDDDEPGDNPNP